MRKNGFYRLLFSYLPVFFVVSLSLLLITYLTLNEMSKKSSIRANELLSQSIAQSIDSVLKSIDDRMIKDILGNEQLKTFFQPTNPEDTRYMDYQTTAALRDMLSSNRSIHSVYLYRVTGRMVLTPSMFSGIDQFGDKEFVGKHLTSLTPHRWIGTRVYREQPYMPPVRVISLVKFANLADRSMMVVNVRTDSLSELIRTMSDSKLNFVDLIDAQGGRIASKDSETDSTGIGKPLSTAYSDYTGWTVRSGIYQEHIVDWVSSLFYVWIAIGFLVIVLGIVWLIYVTRRNYMPIRSITERIEAYARQKQQVLQLERKSDEYKYIEMAIENLLHQSSLLLEENKENLTYRSRHAFLTMLEGGAPGQTDVWRDELLRRAPGLFGGLVAVLIEIDRYSDFTDRYSRRDQILLKHVLSSGIQDAAAQGPAQLWSEWVDHRRMAVVHILSASALDGDGDVISIAERFREWVEVNLTFTITIGIGTFELEPERVSDSYRSALYGLACKASLGSNRLIVPVDLASRPRDEMFRHLQHIRAICQSYRSGDTEWEQLLQDLHHLLLGYLLTRDELASLLNYLVQHLHKDMLELPDELLAIWNNGVIGRLQALIETSESLDEVWPQIHQVLSEAAERMRDVRAGRHHHSLIHQVKKYISENYTNAELSLAHLSDAFNVNASYLSRLFKEEFGEKFNDYVAQVRIEKAVELLKETEGTVNEIAAAVGYTHTLTFIRVFKKRTGYTPGHYRKEMA